MDITPTSFTFLKEDGIVNVQHVVPDPGITWWELSEHYFDFLRGCGYQVTRQELADYFDEISDAE